MKTDIYRYRPAGLDETLTDQYGIEIYYSTDVLNKKIKVREIGCKAVDGSHGFMSCNVLPDIDNFVKDPRKEINLLSLKADINANGEISCRNCSWYA